MTPRRPRGTNVGQLRAANDAGGCRKTLPNDGTIARTMLSPEVLASHQATLELQARDEDRRAPQQEALSALEEELVSRHQRELAIAAERDRLRRELAGLTSP